MNPGAATKPAQCRLEPVENPDGSVTFVLGGVIDFNTVIVLDQQARALFPQYQQITVDLGNVTYVNSAGLALLLEWKRRTELENRSIKILRVPGKLLNIARISEIDDILSL